MLTESPIRPLLLPSVASAKAADVITLDGEDGVVSIPFSLFKAQIVGTISGALAYLGTIAGASVPGSATAGQFYLISTAGTSQGKDWDAGDMAIYRSGAWDQISPSNRELIQLIKTTVTPTPAADKAFLFLRDDGTGLMQLACQFPSGDPVVIATEPS